MFTSMNPMLICRKYSLWSSSHIRVRRLRCGDSQCDYYAHDVQQRRVGGRGEGGGKRGRGGTGWNGIGKEMGSNGNHRVPTRAADHPPVGDHRAVPHGWWSWGSEERIQCFKVKTDTSVSIQMSAKSKSEFSVLKNHTFSKRGFRVETLPISLASVSVSTGKSDPLVWLDSIQLLTHVW